MSDLYRHYSENKLLFGKMYFPHYFRRESPAFHVNIVEVAGRNLDTAIQAPRGSAKSTVEAFLDTIHGICFKRERFIIIVQNTYAKASASLNNIKFEFRDNDRLKGDFNVSMERKDAEGDTIFSHPDGFSVRVLCKGADQLGSIRGERFGAYRPSLILVDDLEDDELVRNAERRLELEKVMKWFLQEAMRRTGKYLWITPIAWGTRDKVERFYFRMANRYSQGSVFHRHGLGVYENQIIRLRSAAHDDHADAAGMLPEMLAYAPTVNKKPAEDDRFMQLRKQTPIYRERNKTNYIFGKASKPLPYKIIPALPA